MDVWSGPSALTRACPERSRREEFYEVYDGDLEIAPLSRALQDWEQIYNHVRPHQALGYLTPCQFVTLWQTQREEVMCH